MKRIPIYRTAMLALTVLCSPLVMADPFTNTVERANDRTQIATGNVGVVDARRDVDRLSDLIMIWDEYRLAGKEIAQKDTERMIAEELRRDLQETSIKEDQADREVAQSGREVRSSKREKRFEPGHRRDDRRDLRDDRRDRRDDVRDEAMMDQLLKEKTAISIDLRQLQQQIDSKKIGEKEAEAKMLTLFNQYLELSRQEVALGIRELREDHREIREDRRETREDIRRN